jgi:hypothetical protein
MLSVLLAAAMILYLLRCDLLNFKIIYIICCFAMLVGSMPLVQYAIGYYRSQFITSFDVVPANNDIRICASPQLYASIFVESIALLATHHANMVNLPLPLFFDFFSSS